MEPDSHNNFAGPEEPHKVALVSIAISLKRIADAVDPPDKSRGTFFEQADNWFNHWISIWRNAR